MDANRLLEVSDGTPQGCRERGIRSRSGCARKSAYFSIWSLIGALTAIVVHPWVNNPIVLVFFVAVLIVLVGIAVGHCFFRLVNFLHCVRAPFLLMAYIFGVTAVAGIAVGLQGPYWVVNTTNWLLAGESTLVFDTGGLVTIGEPVIWVDEGLLRVFGVVRFGIGNETTLFGLASRSCFKGDTDKCFSAGGEGIRDFLSRGLPPTSPYKAIGIKDTRLLALLYAVSGPEEDDPRTAPLDIVVRSNYHEFGNKLQSLDWILSDGHISNGTPWFEHAAAAEVTPPFLRSIRAIFLPGIVFLFLAAIFVFPTLFLVAYLLEQRFLTSTLSAESTYLFSSQ